VDSQDPLTVERAKQHVQDWLREFVIGLNLCPFARPLLGEPCLRIAVCEGTKEAALRTAFLSELDLLITSPEQQIATTLLVFPHALRGFDTYLDFFASAQALLVDAGLEGIVQIASFHPHYRFAGEPPDAASHFSNRSPYPIIHLLREEMLSRVLEDFAGPERIPERNIAALDAIGAAELERRCQAILSRQGRDTI
jgi:uncharacterized protein